MGQEKDTAPTLHFPWRASRRWVRRRTQRSHFTSPGEPPGRGSGEGHSGHTSLPLESLPSVGQEKDTAATLHFPWRASRAWVRRRTQRPHFTSPGEPPGRGSGEGHSGHTSLPLESLPGVGQEKDTAATLHFPWRASRAWVRRRTQRPHFTSPGEPPERGSGEGHSGHTSLPLERLPGVGQEKDTAPTLHFPWRASRAWVRRRTLRPHFTSPGEPPGRGSGEGHCGHTSLPLESLPGVGQEKDTAATLQFPWRASRAWVRRRTLRPHFTSPGEPPERGSGEGHSGHTSLPLESLPGVGQEKDTAVTLHFPWCASRAWVRRRTLRPHFTSPGEPPGRGSGEGHSGHTSLPLESLPSVGQEKDTAATLHFPWRASRAWVRRRTQRSHFTSPGVPPERGSGEGHSAHTSLPLVCLPSVGQEKDTAPTLHFPWRASRAWVRRRTLRSHFTSPGVPPERGSGEGHSGHTSLPLVCLPSVGQEKDTAATLHFPWRASRAWVRRRTQRPHFTIWL